MGADFRRRQDSGSMPRCFPERGQTSQTPQHLHMQYVTVGKFAFNSRREAPAQTGPIKTSPCRLFGNPIMHDAPTGKSTERK